MIMGTVNNLYNIKGSPNTTKWSYFCSEFFSSFKNKYFFLFLVVWLLPPSPPLSGPPTNTRTLFAASQMHTSYSKKIHKNML